MVHRSHLAAAATLAVLLGATGCGGPSRTTVSGKVTYQGKTVTSGSVTLVASDKQVYVGPIQSDGTYSVAGVPVGSVAIGVSSPNPNEVEVRGKGSGALGGKAAAKKGEKPVPPGWFPMPDKFADPTGSGLTGEVKSGNPLDIVVGSGG